MSYVPRVRHIVGTGNWYSNMPGIVAVNFDPTLAENEEFIVNIADGTLIIQNGAPGDDCTLECAVALFIKNCSECDAPVVSLLSATGDVTADANGAITGVDGGGLVRIVKTSAGAYTLDAPMAEQNGKTLTIISTTAFAHTVTQASPGFNGGGASSDVATFAAAAGNSISLIASEGKWYVTNLQGVTLG